MTLKVLVVEDDPVIRGLLRASLAAEGFAVTTAVSLSEATALLQHDPPGLIVLDLGLPDGDGAELVRAVRQRSSLPIVVASAREDPAGKIALLDAGADDYLVKPFSVAELLARIRVALRRASSGEREQSGAFRAGELLLDYDRRRALRGDTEIRLTPKEFELLSLLARNHDRVLTHRAILKAIWGPNAVDQTEHLWTLVAQLRKKIEPDPGTPRYILSEPWVGYRFATGEGDGL